jgi:fructosamine-3-kinase
MISSLWDVIQAQIQQVIGVPFGPCDRRSVAGGSINQTYRLSDGQRTYFVKLNRANKAEMFEAEALGLQEMAATKTIRVPTPLCWGVAAENSYIVLEWMAFEQGGVSAWIEMGRQLAHLHRTTHPWGFGWQRNNTIGDTPQVNYWSEDWTQFFVRHRIGYQLQLAQHRGGHFPQAEELLYAIPALLSGHTPQPSLVHGDLWSGNAGFNQDEEPLIFDPAVYYGDREVDIAMTELFGGFPEAFYQGYRMEWPLDAGYEQRKVLYNLYHILNHFNLFGGSYAHQAEGMMQRAIAMI